LYPILPFFVHTNFFVLSSFSFFFLSFPSRHHVANFDGNPTATVFRHIPSASPSVISLVIICYPHACEKKQPKHKNTPQTNKQKNTIKSPTPERLRLQRVALLLLVLVLFVNSLDTVEGKPPKDYGTRRK